MNECNMDCLHCKFDDCINDEVPQAKPRHQDTQKRNAQRKERYKKDKEQGVCVYCHKKPAMKGMVMCMECHARYSNARSKRRVTSHVDGCRFCGEPCIEGHKVCQRHYDMCVERVAIARAVSKEKKVGPYKPFLFGSLRYARKP